MKAATLALACATALVFAVTSAEARPTHTTDSKAATTLAVSKCKIVIAGTPWRIGAHAGNKYTIAGEGISCTSARAWVRRTTNQRGDAPIKSPPGLTCHSFSTTASGDKLLYSGACTHPPHNIPFFEWAPKVR